MDFGPVMPPGCMQTEQTKLLASFPGFIETIEQKLAGCSGREEGVAWGRGSGNGARFSTRFLVAILGVVVAGWGSGCKQSGHSDTAGPVGQACKAGKPADFAYICPSGYFCEFEEKEDMLKPGKLGTCAAMEQYEPCKGIMLCDSADYSPKCPSILDVAYCDWYQTSLRSGDCVSPGPFVEGGDDGDVKTPTTTK